MLLNCMEGHTAHAYEYSLGQIFNVPTIYSQHLVAAVLHVVSMGISLETLTSMAWNILRSSSRSLVPLKFEGIRCRICRLKKKLSVLLEEVSFFACL